MATVKFLYPIKHASKHTKFSLEGKGLVPSSDPQ